MSDSVKSWLEAYLRGEIEGFELEVLESEDLLFRRVYIVERRHPEWLAARLEDPELSADRRRDVRLALSGPLLRR